MTHERKAQRWLAAQLGRTGLAWIRRGNGGMWNRALGLLVEVRNEDAPRSEFAKRERELFQTQAVLLVAVDAFDEGAANDAIRIAELLDDWNSRRKVLGLSRVA